MEFGEKLQAYRKRRGLTQEELAQLLFVSRAAVSKWESGRGYPSIDSLMAIARFFSVSVDELLCADAAPTIAVQEDAPKKKSLFFALADMSAVLLLFLPLFRQSAQGLVHAVPLLALTGLAPYTMAAYYVAVLGMALSGALGFALDDRQGRRLSLAANAAGTLLFIVSPQPYAATVLFVLLLVKAQMLRKMP